MKSKIFAIATAVTVAVTMASPAFGLTADELQVQINALLAQLSQLQSQLGTLQGAPAGTGACAGISFTRNLTIGSSGADVKCLQTILNQAADTQIAASGVGSAGNETVYFGNLTKAAVVKFQTKNAISPAAGFVGPITRAKLNTMVGGVVVIPPTTPTPGVSGLAVSLASDTPASVSIPKGAFNQALTKVNLTAGTEGNVTISKITVTRSGLSANTDIDLVKIFDGTIQKGNGGTLNSNNQAVFTFTTPIVISAGTTKTLTISADLDSAAGTGRTLIFSVAAATDVVSDASATTGSATGNAMTIIGVTIGSVTIAEGPSNPTSDLAPEVGDTGVRILQMNLLCGSVEDVEVKQVIAVKVGTVNATDISKVELYNDTNLVSLGSVTTFDAEGRATFDLATPLVITKGTSKNLSVRVDIASGSGRTISAKVYDSGAFTVTAVGKTFGYGVSLTDGWTVTNGTATSQTIAAGSLVVTKSASTPAVGYVAPGGTDVPLTTYNLEARGEGVTVTEFVNTVTLGTITYDQVTSCKLVDENSNVVAGPVDTTTAGTITGTNLDYISFTDTFTVPLGVHKYTVKCNLASAITTGTVKIGFDYENIAENASGNDPGVAITAKGAVSNDTVTATPADTDVQGNLQTIRAAAMTVVTLTTPVATTIVPGQQNIHFANVQLGAVSSGENINVTSITVTDNVSGAGDPQGADITNLRLFDASIAQSACTGTGRAWDTTLAMCRIAPIMQPNSTTADADDTTVFTLSTPLVITKSGSSTIKIYGDYKSSGPAANEVHTFFVAAVTDITAVGATTGTTLTTAMKGTSVVGSGQNMTYGASGALAAVVGTGTPNSANIAIGEYGTTGISMAKIKLGGTTNTEDVDIDYVDLTRVGATGADADIAALYLYDGVTLLATGVNRATDTYRFDLTDYVVPAYGSKTWTVKADFNGNLTGATSGNYNNITLATTGGLVGTGRASGTTINATAAVTATNSMYLYRSVPTMTLCTAASTVCGVTPVSRAMTLTSNTEVMRFKITADPAGDVVFTKNVNAIRFTLSGLVADGINTDTTVTVKNITDGVTLDSITTDVSDIVLGTSSTGSVMTSDFSSNTLSIEAGQSKIVSLELDTTDFSTAYDSVQARIANAASDLDWSDVDTASIDNNTFFTWLPLTGDTLTTNP